jgi:small-conductance mechanosensitive channel/CRP-like cAMP-binding protein
MEPSPTWHSMPGHSVLGILVVVGYPALVLTALELARVLGDRRRFASDIVRQSVYLLLPTGTIWLILSALAELPPEDHTVRMAETAFALTGLYLALRLAQAALMGVIDDQTRLPKLLLDIMRIGLSLVWGAVIVSDIWEINLGSLFAAMGVGSVVLGFALQEFLGNLLSGLGLLSAHKFAIGDWIFVDGAPARVVEMDWRTVTLVKGNGDRIVVANSTLAKGNLAIAARAHESASISIPLTFGLDIPPEQVREAVLEVAAAMPAMNDAGGVKCFVTGIGGGPVAAINYTVILPVANPGILSGPRDEFLSRFWYVAQRRGLRLDAVTPPDTVAAPDATARLRMLTAAGAFHGDPQALTQLVQACSYRRYRRGDVLLAVGGPSAFAYFVLTGQLAVSVPNGETEIRVELVTPWQLLVLQETLIGAASPVRVAAEQATDVLAIPIKSLIDVMEANRVIARDIAALAEARRRAILTLNKGLRSAA